MKKWLVNNFLPMWAKETVLQENRALRQENKLLLQKLQETEAYARGLRTGLRVLGRRRSGGEQ